MGKNMGVYKITNLVNGKVYIGSSKELEKREMQHKSDLKCGRHHNEYLQNSYTKHGKENFEFNIIEFVENEDELIEREQFYIDKYNACNRKYGYNLNPYARGGGGAKGERNGWYGKGYMQLGNKNPSYGKKHTRETKRILSIKNTRYGEKNHNYGNKGVKNPLSKQIAQIDPDTLKVIKIWGASIEIERELGFHGGNICQVCIYLENHSKRKQSYGYYWCYEKDINKCISSNDYIHSQYKKVAQIDIKTKNVLKVYDKISDAAKEHSINSENISRCCKGKNATAAGYVWIYEEELNKKNIDERVARALIEMSVSRSKKGGVVQLTLDDEYVHYYPSSKRASEITGIAPTSISRVCNKQKKYKTAGGFKWMYYDDYIKLNKDQQASIS